MDDTVFRCSVLHTQHTIALNHASFGYFPSLFSPLLPFSPCPSSLLYSPILFLIGRPPIPQILREEYLRLFLRVSGQDTSDRQVNSLCLGLIQWSSLTWVIEVILSPPLSVILVYITHLLNYVYSNKD